MLNFVKSHGSDTIALIVPFFVAQRAHCSRLEPPGDTVEVEGMVAGAPCLGALFGSVRYLLSLAFHAGLHDVVSADGAVVNVDVPCPECYSIPLFHFEARLRIGFNHFCSLNS